MPKKYLLFLSLVTAVMGALLLGIIYKANQPEPLKVGNSSFKTEVVATDETRQRGLSGRDSLPTDTAMVFVFDEPSQRCFWMKDMKFSIDIVWLDESKKIVGIEKNVAPDSYPESFCHDNTRYVVEFVSGTADKLNLREGEQFTF